MPLDLDSLSPHDFSVEVGCCQMQSTLSLLRSAPLGVCICSSCSCASACSAQLVCWRVQEAKQLQVITMLLGNCLDRTLSWCCVQGRLHGARASCQPLLYLEASLSFLGAADSADQQTDCCVEPFWLNSQQQGDEIPTYATIAHFCVRVLLYSAATSLLTICLPPDAALGWQKALKGASARLADLPLQPGSPASPVALWVALYISFQDTLSEDASSHAVTLGRYKLMNAMAWQARTCCRPAWLGLQARDV